MSDTTPEALARRNIDRMLATSGYTLQDYRSVNLRAAKGVAVREFQLGKDAADYLLFADRKAAAVVEAKPEGATLTGVAEQSARYAAALPATVPSMGRPIPFAYETTGVETLFRDERDPEPRSRRVFAVHRPETLLAWAGETQTLRARLRQMPTLDPTGLRPCQTEAIEGIERSLAADRPRTLVQMATGSGKTFTAVALAERLLRYAGVRRVLFLVDRSNLGRQTLREFQNFVVPGDGRRFTDLYNVQLLGGGGAVGGSSRVVISTIQRLYSVLRGSTADLDDLDERSAYELGEQGEPQAPVEVVYNESIPPEAFDVVIVDECHRSIYNVWRGVLDYFDAFLVGLTATPSKQTLGFFGGNLATEYPHVRAVADGVNVGYDVFRIRTEITEKGSKVEKGFTVGKMDKRSRRVIREQLDEDLAYDGAALDRTVESESQIRTVVRTFRDSLPALFPDRTLVPKTLIFAKSDAHAETIVGIVREEFGRGNAFCKKITYQSAEKPETLLSEFRTALMPRIAVTVDMIATGTDIRALECLVFMRSVASGIYFEQMKGRGTRIVDPEELRRVTPDAHHKTHFVIVDAVGVCERDKGESRPLERKRSVSFDALLQSIALGADDDDTLTSLASRLARLSREIAPADAAALQAAAGVTLHTLTAGLLHAVDVDAQAVEAVRMGLAGKVEEVTPEALAEARQGLVDAATEALADPAMREALKKAKASTEIVLDDVSIDAVIFAGFDAHAQEASARYVASFRAFLDEHRDEIAALKVFYEQPYGKRRLTLRMIGELAEALKARPHGLYPEALWAAYDRLDAARVRGTSDRRLTVDLVSLVRRALEETDELAPYAADVDARYYAWLADQERAGRRFTSEQAEWLEMIKTSVATNLDMTLADLSRLPFSARGGQYAAQEVFGASLPALLDELTAVLAP